MTTQRPAEHDRHSDSSLSNRALPLRYTEMMGARCGVSTCSHYSLLQSARERKLLVLASKSTPLMFRIRSIVLLARRRQVLVKCSGRPLQF